jgi:DNA-binding NarL/FixJ family response regulator
MKPTSNCEAIRHILRDMKLPGYRYLKNMPAEALISAIQTVYNGGTVLQHDMTSMLLKELKKMSEKNPEKTHSLSHHEPEGSTTRAI